MLKSNSKPILIGQMLAGVFSLVAVSFTAKYVGPLIFGFCSILVLILNILITLLDYGACSWAARELASESMSIRTYTMIKNSKTKLFMLALLLSPGFLVLVPSEYKAAVLLLLYPALWNTSNYNQQYFLAKGLVPESVILVVVDRLCWLLIIPFSIINFEKVLAFTLPLMTGLVVQNFTSQALIKLRKAQEGVPVIYSNRDLFSRSKHFGRISTTGVLSNFDGVLLSSISTLEASSGYLLAQRFRNPLTIVFTSIAMRLRPIAASRNRLDIIHALQSDAKLLSLGSFINLAIAISFLFYSSKFFGAAFDSINVLLFCGALSSLPLGVLILSSNLLSALGNEKYVARVNLSYSVFTLIGVFLGSICLGSLGAVLLVFLVILFHAIFLSIKFFKELGLLRK